MGDMGSGQVGMQGHPDIAEAKDHGGRKKN
jgi:hypothetical protein